MMHHNNNMVTICCMNPTAVFRHGTGLWRLNDGVLTHLQDLPGCGDTAFPSIVRLSSHRYLIANYTSPLARCEEWSWVSQRVSYYNRHS